MEQEGIVRLRFRCQPKSCKPGIILLVFRIPGLRIGRVRHDPIQVQRFGFMIFIQPGPVLFQCICIPDFDIIRKYISHDQIHTGQVERIFLQFLGIVLNGVSIFHVFRNGMADGYQKGTGSTGGIIDFNMIFSFRVVCHNICHKHGHFMGCVEFPCFFACIGSEHGNQVFIDIPQHVIVLVRISHGNLFDEVHQISHSLRLGSCISPQTA